MPAKDRFHEVALKSQRPDYHLYLAVPVFTYREFFCRALASQTIQEAQLSLVVYDPDQEVILQWID